MNAGHRVKSVSMGKYSAEEIKSLEDGGTEVSVGGRGMSCGQSGLGDKVHGVISVNSVSMSQHVLLPI